MRAFSYFARGWIPGATRPVRPARAVCVLGVLGALCAVLAARPAWSADQTLGVTARIAATCSFTEASAYLIFPEIDPSGTETYITSSTVRVRCTRGTRLSLRVGDATQSPVLRQMAAFGFTSHTPVEMPYRLDWATGPETTGGFSDAAQDYVITVTGTLTPAHYQDSADGHFTDRVTLELIP